MRSTEDIEKSLDKSKDEIKYEVVAHLLKSAIDSLVKESKWFTSIGLALLGFYSALLIQLKLSEIEPINLTALIALLLVGISLISGFWIKLCSMKEDIVDDLLPAIMKIFEKKLEVNLDDRPRRKTPDEVVESISKSLPTSLIIVQATTLFAAIVVVCFYLLNFLI